MTGEALSEGYPIQSIIPSTTGEWLDLLRGDVHGYFSPAAAACIQNDWNLGSRAIFETSLGVFSASYPLLARPKPGAAVELVDEATADPKRLKTLRRDGQGARPCWSDIIRSLPERRGQRCLLIVATDPKKRVWNRARVGVVGEATPFLLFDSSRSLLTVVQAPVDDLVPAFELVEAIYTSGFTKSAIERFLPSESKPVAAVGMAQAMRWEAALKPLRLLPWFPVLSICCQRSEAPVVLSAPTKPTATPKATKEPTDPTPTLGGLFDE